MAKKVNLTNLQKQVMKSHQAMLDAQAKHDEAVMALATARTDTYNRTLVQTARDLGINPDNFETQEQLKQAIRTVS